MQDTKDVGVKDIGVHEWFAGQALAGLLSNAAYPPQGSGEPLDQFVARVTDTAYRMADAMINHERRPQKQAAAW